MVQCTCSLYKKRKASLFTQPRPIGLLFSMPILEPFFLFPGGRPGALSASSNLQYHFIELVAAFALLPELNCKYALLNLQQYEKFERKAAKKLFFLTSFKSDCHPRDSNTNKTRTADRGLVALRIGRQFSGTSFCTIYSANELDFCH